MALVVVGAIAIGGNCRAGPASSQLILKDNYRSVLAAQRMKEAIERHRQRRHVSGRWAKRTKAPAWCRAIGSCSRRNCKCRRDNVTEPGEQDATDQLSKTVACTTSSSSTSRRELTEVELPNAYLFRRACETAFHAVKECRRPHPDAESGRHAAQERCGRAAGPLGEYGPAGDRGASPCWWVCCLSSSLTNRLLRPLSVLTQAVDAAGRRATSQARRKSAGDDEIGQLADAIQRHGRAPERVPQQLARRIAAGPAGLAGGDRQHSRPGDRVCRRRRRAEHQRRGRNAAGPAATPSRASCWPAPRPHCAST